jgi:hypothetical protein
LFDELGGFDEDLEVCEDYDLWLRVACGYDIGLVDKKLITKYAGHDDQLSFKHWGMDRFRVKALEKLFFDLSEVGKVKTLLPRCDGTQTLVWAKLLLKKELLKKYTLLLKGAIKYDKIEDIKEYKEKIKLYE